MNCRSWGALLLIAAGFGRVPGGPSNPLSADALEPILTQEPSTSGVITHNDGFLGSAVITYTAYSPVIGQRWVRWRRMHPSAPLSLFLPDWSVLPKGPVSVRLESDLPATSIVRTDWPRAGGASMYGNAIPDRELHVPLVLIEDGGAHTVISVQNASRDVAAHVELILLAAEGAMPATTLRIEIDAGASVDVDTRNRPFSNSLPDTGGRFVGAMKVTSDTPVAVAAQIVLDQDASAAFGYAGVGRSQAARRLFAPLIRRRFRGYDTGIAVVNPQSHPVEVSVIYRGSHAGGVSECAGTILRHGPAAMPAHSTRIFYQGPGGGSGLPDACVGSAEIEASDAIVAVVNDTLNFGEHSAAYEAIPATGGGTTVLLPLIRRRHLDSLQLTSGIQVMNLGPERALVQLRLLGTGVEQFPVCGRACIAHIPPLESRVFYPGAHGVESLAEGARGIGIIDSNQPVAVIVNEASESGAGDMATYVGATSGRLGADLGRCPEGGGWPTGIGCQFLPSLGNGGR